MVFLPWMDQQHNIRGALLLNPACSFLLLCHIDAPVMNTRCSLFAWTLCENRLITVLSTLWSPNVPKQAGQLGNIPSVCCPLELQSTVHLQITLLILKCFPTPDVGQFYMLKSNWRELKSSPYFLWCLVFPSHVKHLNKLRSVQGKILHVAGWNQLDSVTVWSPSPNCL